MFRLAYYVIVGYVIAAGISDYVSFDFTQTDWVNLWTYVMFAFGMVGAWCLGFVFWSVLLTSILAMTSRGHKRKKRF